MTLSFCSFSSGSSGNSYLVRSETTAILVDAGISCKRITDGLNKTDTPEKNLKGILVTHEHWDHVDGIRVMLKKYKNIDIIANRLTFAGMKHSVNEERRQYFVTGDSFVIGDLNIETFAISHDAADPVGYHIRHEGKQVSIVTDTGFVHDDLIPGLETADILVMESNHDVGMLRMGSYPDYLKDRILGNRGHLSNESAGKYIARIAQAGEKARCVLLAHLSKDNNDPETAEQTVCNILEEHDFINGRDMYIKTINRNEISMIYEI